MRRAIVLATLLASALGGEPAYEFWPGASYDARIPTIQQVLGYAPGERITTPADIVRYLEALAAAAPSRIKVFEYGRSWEGRKLVYAVAGSEANLKRLAEIRAGIKRLADPRKTPEGEAARIAAGLPAIVWLGYGVHGNEISSPDAALVVAYHLLAARNDKVADTIAAGALVLIAPLQNPDGRERFIHNFEQSRGPEPDPSPYAAERNEPWPGGRGNHYLFDLNRDWLALTQPEIRAQVKVLREWLPQVCADLHEMGTDSTYYFAPPAEPYNPHLTRTQRENLSLIGRNHAKWFDRYGFDYFTREVFDAFYPGYGDSWPAYYGAVAMTYEQASARGLAALRSDDTEMKFRDTVRRHFVASLSTAEAAALNREKLLKDFYRFRQTAVEEGKTEEVREYLLARGRDPAAADKLAGILVEHGVEVERATAPFKAGGRDYPAGTYRVRLAQPSKRLARVLLDPKVGMDEAFVKEQERRRRRKLPGEIYDVTAWSLPLLFNVECAGRPEVSGGSFEAAGSNRTPAGRITRSKAAVAYLAPWGMAAGRLLAAAHREGLTIHTTDRAFAVNGGKFPAGTLIFKVHDNAAGLGERLEKLAAATGAEIHATDTSWVDEGVNFGSRYVVRLKRPTIGIAWDTPVSPQAAGATRFVIERQFGYPVTAVRTAQLAGADLSRFHVLILPDGRASGYAQALGEAGTARLKSWVSNGGTLIGIQDGVAFLADRKVDLLAVQQEDAFRDSEPAKKPDKPEAEPRAPGKLIASEAEYAKAIQAEKELPDAVAGVIVRAKVDPDHWLGAGVPETVNALVGGRSIFTPIKLDKGVNVAIFEAPDRLLASGYLWEENRRQMAYKPLVIAQPLGRGIVIGFTADPNFRGHLDGLNVLFLNAVFRSVRR